MVISATERNRGAAFLASFLAGAVPIGGQIVLGFAPFLPGLASLPMTVALIITAAVVATNLPKMGAKIPTAVGPVFVPMQNLALFGVDRDDSGVASALVNASQQIGGSLGIALFSTIAAVAAAGTSLAALSAGYSMVFLWAAGVAILIAPIALLLINIDRKTFTGTEGDAPVVHLGLPLETAGQTRKAPSARGLFWSAVGLIR